MECWNNGVERNFRLIYDKYNFLLRLITLSQKLLLLRIIMKECSVLQLWIRPERIHYLKFILEGYEGLAIQSTVDPGKGLVELRYPPERDSDVRALLDDLRSGIFPKK